MCNKQTIKFHSSMQSPVKLSKNLNYVPGWPVLVLNCLKYINACFLTKSLLKNIKKHLEQDFPSKFYIFLTKN